MQQKSIIKIFLYKISADVFLQTSRSIPASVWGTTPHVRNSTPGSGGTTHARLCPFPRAYSPAFPLPRISHLSRKFSRAFALCNLSRPHRSPHFRILVDALSPFLALIMQDFSHDENLANQMDTSSAFSMLPDPDEGFGGAGVG